MSDRPNSPIRIPIHFVEGDDESSHDGMESPEEDVIEIDGDAVNLDDDEDDSDALDAEIEPLTHAAFDAPRAVEQAHVEPEGEPEPEPEMNLPPVQTAAPFRRGSTDPLPRPAVGTGPLSRPPASDSGPLSQPPSQSEARPELSIEAFRNLTQELRQKNEAAERLTAEKTDLYDRLLRRQAEFENFRKRNEREVQDTYRRARADVLSDLLPALDNFDLALRHAEGADADTLREGIALIHRQLFDVLGRHGLEPVEAAGKLFDPELHEAVATEANADVEDQTVLEEFQRGYKLGDRLLRPARVKVSTQG